MTNTLRDDVLRGRDCKFPTWLANHEPDGSNCAYDSLVLNSTGISALTLAARCAQSETFRDAVHIYGKPVEEDRRLRAGVTLRARTLDYYAAACNVSRSDLLSRLYQCDANEAATYEQRYAMTIGNPKDGFRFAKKVSWMNSNAKRKNRTPGVSLAYGVRNSRLNRALQDLAVEAGVTLHPEPNLDAPTLISKACGSRPLIVNGTPMPLNEAPLIADRIAPTQCVVAAQVPFTAPSIEQRGVIDAHSSFVTLSHRDGAMDMGVFYPFRDDLSPEATFYGIVYRVIPGPKDVDKEAEQAFLFNTLIGIGDALGLEPLDPEETRGLACVPVSPWKNTANLHDGVLDISRLSGAGAPIITGDGMTRAAVAGYVGAEALLAGQDPVDTINQSLHHYRQVNWELCLMMTRFSGVAAILMRNFPGAFMKRNGATYYRDMWAPAH